MEFQKLCKYGPIIGLLNKYVSDKNYRFVDKLLRAFNADEVIRTMGEILRDARSRYPKILPSTNLVAEFYDEVTKDIKLAHAVAGLAYSYLDEEFFNSCVKIKKDEEEGE